MATVPSSSTYSLHLIDAKQAGLVVDLATLEDLRSDYCLCLVGKLATDRPFHKENFQSTMLHLWNFLEATMAKLIGNQFGNFLEVSTEDAGDFVGRILHFWVHFDITQPLIGGTSILTRSTFQKNYDASKPLTLVRFAEASLADTKQLVVPATSVHSSSVKQVKGTSDSSSPLPPLASGRFGG
ncbi:hypothetical protein GBA52_025133 [Prunus armeniaca]|nr:hypothetical protein GBA52_025133 [Prunus armeniaca]